MAKTASEKKARRSVAALVEQQPALAVHEGDLHRVLEEAGRVGVLGRVVGRGRVGAMRPS